MKQIIVPVLLSVFLVYSTSTRAAEPGGAPAPESAWPGHVSYAIGYKRLSLGDSGPAPSHQFEFAGVDFDIRKANWPVSIAAQTLVAAGGGFISAEANLGLRKIWQASPRFEPFVGAGLTVASVSDVFFGDGTAVGGYVEAGIYWKFARHWHAGFRAEYSYAQGEFTDDGFITGTRTTTRINPGGAHALALIGYNW